ncbi:MAG: hypothetical protein GTO51_05250 [Candidatus Latescibacteria bacterium]|nr:hypothetical protein [Candidatus Latescibacterota bacterium]NIO28409.1 hypothetical protein [Candidatus Latescibacterota bacterium]NIO55958.1 hypothetical protein [Candidatus Latescibacterota bacterium]NIT01922.1 hypothetical protein [Candidatus Latescibacterota bacterium]
MISINKEALDQIRRHAESSYPAECCGALFGVKNNDTRSVSEIIPLPNRWDGESAKQRYLITADDYIYLEKTAEEKGADILGFYHSHPDHAAQPSDYDREQALPVYAYLIVAVEKGTARDIACWVLCNDRSAFSRETMNVTSS